MQGFFSHFGLNGMWRVALRLQELVEKKYRGKVEVVFRPDGVIKEVEIPEFFHVKREGPDGKL